MVIFSICAASTSWSRYLSPWHASQRRLLCRWFSAKKTRDAKGGMVWRENFQANNIMVMKQLLENSTRQLPTALFSLSAGPHMALLRRPSGHRLTRCELAQLWQLSAWSPLLGMNSAKMRLTSTDQLLKQEIRSDPNYKISSSVAQDQLLPNLNSV